MPIPAWKKRVVVYSIGLVLVVLGVIYGIPIKRSYDHYYYDRISRARADFRALSVALYSYQIDEGLFPHAAIRNGLPEISHSLSTPIAYVTKLFGDPFTDLQSSYQYALLRDGWLLSSPGPDGDYDIPRAILSELTENEILSPGESFNIFQYTYDPTNGTASSGDVWRLSE